MYVIVPSNCTDRLQPLDASVNQAAKHFIQTKFESQYADRISAQQQCGQDIQPVDLKLSVVKPIGAQWMIDIYDYLKGCPNIITNGFKHLGISDILASQLYQTCEMYILNHVQEYFIHDLSCMSQ